MKLKEIAESLGFIKICDYYLDFIDTKGVYIQKIDGFTFYLKNWEYLIYDIPAIYVGLDRTIDSSLIKSFEQAALDNACSLYTINEKNDTLIISLPEGNYKSQEYKDEMETIFKRLIKLFEIENIQPMELCPVCKQKAEYSVFGDDYVPIHEECINKHVEELKKLVEEQKSSNRSPLLSIITSIVFSLIGLIPALLCSLFIYDYITPLLLLISIGSIGGYYLVNAYPSKELKLITSLIPTIIIIAFVIFSFFYMSSMKELTLVEYLLADNWIGIRKIVFGILLSFSGFGLMKIVSSFKKDYTKELEKFIN